MARRCRRRCICVTAVIPTLPHSTNRCWHVKPTATSERRARFATHTIERLHTIAEREGAQLYLVTEPDDIARVGNDFRRR